MKQSTWIIISLVISLFSLIYIFTTYYGINRYLTLYVYSPDSYFKEYSKLTHGDEKNRIVISMASEYDRINKVVINSLLDQTVRVDRILINIPEDEQEIPKFLKNQYFIKVNFLGKDYGKANKYLPTLMVEKDGNSKVIILDRDDVVYGKDFIQELVETSNKHKNSIIKEGENMVLKSKYFKPSFYEKINDHMLTDYIAKHKIPVEEMKYGEKYTKMG